MINKITKITVAWPAVLIFILSLGIAAQAQTATPTPIPDEPDPSQPTYNTPERPIPDMSRVGVEAGEELPLTLDQAIELALKNNNDIDISRNDSESSGLDLRGTRGVYDPLFSSENYYERSATPTASSIGGAVNGSVVQSRFYNSAGVSGYSPKAGGSYSATFNASRTTTSNTNSFLNPQFPSALTLNYTQPLWRNFRIDVQRRNIMVAKKNIAITDSQLKLKTFDVVNNVEQAYWDLVYALKNVQIQLDTLKQAHDQLDSNKRLASKGVLAPIEIVAAQAQISTYEQNVYAAKEAVTRAENTLKTILLPDRNASEWSKPLIPTTPADLEVPQIGLEIAKNEAFKNRPEIEQFDLQQDINKIDQKYYKNQTKPQIDLVGTYTSQGLAGTETAAAINPTTGLSRVPPNLIGGYGNSLGNLLQQDYPTYHAGLVITLPFGNRVAKANYGKTLVDAKRLENQRAQAEQTIEGDVRNALQALRSAESRLDAATQGRLAAEELYSSETRQFRAGTSTFYLVAQRQNELAAARGLELQARTALNKAIATFNRAIGTILSVHNVTVVK